MVKKDVMLRVTIVPFNCNIRIDKVGGWPFGVKYDEKNTI